MKSYRKIEIQGSLYNKGILFMNVLHLLISGNVGGIEKLILSYARYSKLNNIFAFVLGGGVVYDEMIQNHFNVHSLFNKSNSQNNHFNIHNIYTIYNSICRIIIENDVNIVVEHHSSPLLVFFLTLIKKKFPFIKIIEYAHCNASYMVQQKNLKKTLIRKLIFSLSFKKFDKIIAISESVKRSLFDYFKLTSTQVVLVYNGVDLGHYLCLDREYSSSNHGKVIFVGRLVVDKGVQKIIKAAKLLPSSFKFTIVGDGPYKENLIQMASNAKNIEFLGERNDVPLLLSQHDIFVHLPICDEGFGLTVVEALASGLICIVNRKGGLPEIIDDGVNGYIIDDSPDVLAKKILSIKDYSVFNKSSIKKANEFSIFNFVNNLDCLFNNLIQEK